VRGLIIAASCLLSATAVFADTAQERLTNATDVFKEIMATPDKGIPQDLLAKAQCIVIVPGMKKAAFIVGGQYGKGFAECRQPDGTGWGAPAAVRVEGGSVGFQIGGSSTDVVMLIMNKRGMDRLISDKFTIGADASVAAGPVGRTAAAATDTQLHAEILSWSRTRGLFAGIALNGATLRPDEDSDRELYGKTVTNREILTSNMRSPEGAHQLRSALDRYSMSKGANNADRSK